MATTRLGPGGYPVASLPSAATVLPMSFNANVNVNVGASNPATNANLNINVTVNAP